MIRRGPAKRRSGAVWRVSAATVLLFFAALALLALVWVDPRWHRACILFSTAPLLAALGVLSIRLRRWIVLGVLLAAAAITLLPFFWLLCASIKTKDDLFTYTFLPMHEEPAADESRKPDATDPRITATLRTQDRLSPTIVSDSKSGSRPFLGVAWNRLTLANFGSLFGIGSSTTRTVSTSGETDSTTSTAAMESKPPPRPFLDIGFARYILNSFFVASTYTILVVLFASMAGFALAKYRFPGMRAVIAIMLGFVMIPGEILLAPTYELLYHIGWIDTLRALIIPSSINIFAIFLYRQSMLSIPDELLDAARVDGCSEFRIYWEIVLRLSRPMTGAIVLISFLWSWNSFLWPQIVLRSEENYTLPVVLSQMVGVYEQNYPVVMAGTVLAVLPVIVLFLLLQREFISGLTRGALKG